MRGALFLAIIALCALTDEASAVARPGGAGARAGKSKKGTETGGDRERPGETATAAARRKRGKTVPSHDRAQTHRKNQSAVVIGAVREDRGNQQFGSRKRLWDEDDVEEEEEGGEYSNEDWGDDEENQHDAALDDEEEEEEEEEGGGSFSEETDLSEETEEEEEEYRTEARGRGRGRGYDRNARKTTAGAAYGGGARSNSHPNRRATTHYGHDDLGRGERRRGADPQPSSRKKAKAKGGVMKSVGKATGSSMKAMVHALQPKAVGLGEILDTWKIEQIIGKPPGRVTKCAATVEFRRDGTVATSFDGRETVSDFTFRAHAWPRACTIEFEAKAFQGPWDEEPVWKVYKGSFSRKLLDPKIITLEGTIYDVMGKMMWKRRVKSGKFTARRRPSRLSRGGGGGGGASSSKNSARKSTIPDREADERREDGGRARGDRGSGEGTRRSGNGKGTGKGSRRTRSSRPAGSGRSGRREEL